MAGFDDYALSLAMRDAIEDLVIKVIDRERPKYRYGVVASIDRTNKIAWVTLTGETDPIPIHLGEIQSFQIGQQVRVGGLRGDRYIDEGFSGPQKFQTWNMHGPLRVARFDDWTYYRDFEPEFLISILTVPGSTATTYDLLFNGAIAETVTIPGSTKAVLTSLEDMEVIDALEDFLAPNVTVVGTGAEGLVIEVYGR